MRRGEQGRTLFELLVALALAALLLTMSLPVLLGAARTAMAQERQQGAQQDVRLALAGLSRDLRMAGQFGCASLAPGETLAGAPPWGDLAGFSADGAVLRVQYGLAGAALTGLDADASGRLRRLEARLDDSSARLGEARYLVLASCEQAALIDTAGVGHRQGADGYRLDLERAAWSPVAPPPASLELLKLVSRVYASGSYGGRQGLYLFELGDDGRWQGPIELVAGASALTVTPLRDGDCPAARLWQLTLELEAADGSTRARSFRTRVAGRGGRGCEA